MADHGAWLLLAAAVAALAGCSWLALAMKAHWSQVLGAGAPPASARRILRTLGGAGLAVSAVLCFRADRPLMAALVWIMLLAAGATGVALVLAWRPAALRLFWPTTHR